MPPLTRRVAELDMNRRDNAATAARRFSVFCLLLAGLTALWAPASASAASTNAHDLCAAIGATWSDTDNKCYCPAGTCTGNSTAINARAICQGIGGTWTQVNANGGNCSSTVRGPDDLPTPEPKTTITAQEACSKIGAEWNASDNRCICQRDNSATVCSGVLDASNAAQVCRSIGGTWDAKGPNTGYCKKPATGGLGLDDACRTVGGTWDERTRDCKCLTEAGQQYCSGVLQGSTGRTRCRQLGGEWIVMDGNRGIAICRMRSEGIKPEDPVTPPVPEEGTTTPPPPDNGAAEKYDPDFGRFPFQGPAVLNHASSVVDKVKNASKVFCESKVGGTWIEGPGQCDCSGRTCSAQPCVLAGGKWNAGKGACDEHPWAKDTGRDIVDAELDWQLDSLKLLMPDNIGEFLECMQPQIVMPGCPYCIPAAMGGYIDDGCSIPYVNPGVIYEFWWPEAEIEINNFGLAAYNPLREGRADLLRKVLAERIHTQFKIQYLEPYLAKLGINVMDSGIPSELENDPWFGNTAFAGLLPGDQTYHAEAHVYATSLQDRLSKKQCQGCGYFDFIYEEIWDFCIPIDPVLFNGYWKGNPEYCFYDTLDPPAKVVKAWTESMGLPTGVSSFTPDTRCSGLPTDADPDTSNTKHAEDKDPNYAKYWRLPGCSKIINQWMYKAAVPFGWNKVTPFTFNVSLMNDDWRKKKSCLSYRLANWGAKSPGYPDDWKTKGNEPAYRYYELQNMGVEALKLKDDDENDKKLGDALDRICYFGGGELYPLLGSLEGQFTEYTANAYLARRAIELAGQVSHKHLYNRPDRGTKQKDDEQRNHCGGEDHVNRFSRNIKAHQWDKDIDKLQRIYPDVTECFQTNDIDDRNNPLFGGKYGQLPANGSVRYIYWNKRTACSCELHGAVSSPEKDRGFALDGNEWGWGCMPYPYDNYDYGRGNIEESKNHGLEGVPALVPFCNFPYIPGAEDQSICKIADKSDYQSIVDWMGDITISIGPEKPCAEDPPEVPFSIYGALANYLAQLIINPEDYVYEY